jgi:hypothetical protein
MKPRSIAKGHRSPWPVPAGGSYSTTSSTRRRCDPGGCTFVDPTDHGGVDVLPMGGVDDAARTAPRCAAATSLASSTRRFDHDVDVELSRAARLGDAPPASSRPGSQPSWCLDAWLTGHCDGRARTSRPRIAGATRHLVFNDAPHAVRPRLNPARRAPNFDEVLSSLTGSTALFEAR